MSMIPLAQHVVGDHIQTYDPEDFYAIQNDMFYGGYSAMGKVEPEHHVELVGATPPSSPLGEDSSSLDSSMHEESSFFDSTPFVDTGIEDLKRYKYSSYIPTVSSLHSIGESPTGIQQFATAIPTQPIGFSDLPRIQSAQYPSPQTAYPSNYVLVYPNSNVSDYNYLQQHIADAYYQGLYQNYLYSTYMKNYMAYQNYYVAMDREENPKKRKASQKKFSRRVRAKISPEKGAVQCVGKNRKTGNQCRNAALMEYFGPKPKYCAEHIHLDEQCLYTKCCSTYHKIPGDKKKCREVVLKEFGFCHKHYHDQLAQIPLNELPQFIDSKLARVSEILIKLESQAQEAKKVDSDIYQRKNKLIPKFLKMKDILKTARKNMRI